MKLEWRAVRFDTGKRKKEWMNEWMKERQANIQKERGGEKEIMFCKFTECKNKNWKTSQFFHELPLCVERKKK